MSNCDQTSETLNERILILKTEAFVSLAAVRKTMWIPSKHSRKSVLFPILNLNPGRPLHNEDAGSPMICTAEPAKHRPREEWCLKGRQPHQWRPGVPSDVAALADQALQESRVHSES